MRPGEILGLRTGCCPDPAPGPDGRAGRHLIRGLEFKTATDEDGNHQSGGAEREVPWVAITPVVNAIRVLERMVPDGHLLFDHHAHDLPASRPGTGSLKPSALRRPDRGLRGLGEPGGGQPRPARRGHPRRPARENRPRPLPQDPGLAHRPPAQRAGRPGHPVRAPAHRLRLDIRGIRLPQPRRHPRPHRPRDRPRGRRHRRRPARRPRKRRRHLRARRPPRIRAAATAPRFAGTPITLASARKLLKNEDAMIYDNPHALVLCHYKRDTGPLPPRQGEGHPQPRPLRPRLRQHRPHRPAGRPAPRSRAHPREPGRARPAAGRRPAARQRRPGSATRPTSTTAPASPPERTPDDPRARRARTRSAPRWTASWQALPNGPTAP